MTRRWGSGDKRQDEKVLTILAVCNASTFRSAHAAQNCFFYIEDDSASTTREIDGDRSHTFIFFLSASSLLTTPQAGTEGKLIAGIVTGPMKSNAHRLEATMTKRIRSVGILKILPAIPPSRNMNRPVCALIDGREKDRVGGEWRNVVEDELVNWEVGSRISSVAFPLPWKESYGSAAA